MDNLPANKTPAIRRWARRENAGLCFTPANASWANPRRNPGRFAPLSWPARTTAITPHWPAGCRTTCAGATPTPAIPTSWPPSAANGPASAASAGNAGAAPSRRLHDRPADVAAAASVLDCGELAGTGLAAGYAAPDVLERLTRLAVRDLDRAKMQLLPFPEEFAQVGLGEEVHRLA
jgi:hypothetical protein